MAVKFNAERTKKKFYLKWREALPIARKARRVREKHDNLILCMSSLPHYTEGESLNGYGLIPKPEYSINGWKSTGQNW